MTAIQQLIRDIKNLWKLNDAIDSVDAAASDIAALSAVDLACDAYNANPSEATAQAVVDADSNLLDRIRDWFADKAGAQGGLVEFNFDAAKLINQQRDDAYLTEYLYRNKVLREKYKDPRVDLRCKTAADAAKDFILRRDPLPST